jgi:hypothetical protein
MKMLRFRPALKEGEKLARTRASEPNVTRRFGASERSSASSASSPSLSASAISALGAASHANSLALA